jgi:adenylate cyclase
MATDSIKRRLAAILSADAVGYSRLMARDDQAAVRTLKAHRDTLGSHVRQYGGRVVDEAGDNLLAEFPSVVDAVGCAFEAQRTLSERNAELSEPERMTFRVGVHLGDILAEEDRIYGDGVNIAARLQALADSGGICISGTVYDQVRSHYGALCEDRGEQRLKNIEQPMRTYRIRVADRQPPAGSDLTVPGFGGRPAIAILAFDNMSNDPDQEYFGDGISEDLITHLSCMCRFPVISRNSSFSYKGRSVDIKQVSRDLGARYIVEGSVRRAGSRVRINAQLIDATTGHHLWAERYDRELDDIFVLQDEITETIAKALAPVVGGAERRRVLARAPESLDAWDCLQRAQWHFRRLTPESNRAVKTFCRRALELDPDFAEAKAFLATSFLFDIFNFWTDEPAAALQECLRNAEEAVGLDEGSPTCHEALGWAHTFAQQPERAIAEFDRSLALNPSFSRAHWGLGVALYSRGQADEAVAAIEKATRLSRHDPMLNLFEHNLGMAHFVAGRYQLAADCARCSIALNSDVASPQRLLAACCGHLGRVDEAQEAIAALRRISPDFSIKAFRQMNPMVAEAMLEGLRKAGWTGS